MKKKVSLLEKHRQPRNGQCELCKSIEHIHDHGENQSPNVDTAIVFVPVVQFGPEKDGGGDEGNYYELHHLEDMDEGVPLYEEPFFFCARLQKLQIRDGVAVVDEGGSVPGRLVVRDRDVVLELLADVKPLESAGEFCHRYVAVRLVFVRPILPLVLLGSYLWAENMRLGLLLWAWLNL